METFNINIEDYNGPFDIFLTLIEKKKIKLNSINISEIIDDYINYINTLVNDKLDVKAEFLAMLSHLVKIKSIEIINNELYLKEKEKLKEQIMDYSLVKNISNFLSKRENKDIYSFSINEIKKFNNIYTEDNSMLSIKNLQIAFKKCLENQKIEKNKPTLKINLKNEFDYEKTKNKIIENINILKSINFNILIKNLNFKNKFEIISLFMLILEEYKKENINILINDNNDIIITKYCESDINV